MRRSVLGKSRRGLEVDVVRFFVFGEKAGDSI